MKWFKISSVKNISHINKKSAFSPKLIKNSVNMNDNEKLRDEYHNLAFSINNYLNQDILNRIRLSSY